MGLQCAGTKKHSSEDAAHLCDDASAVDVPTQVSAARARRLHVCDVPGIHASDWALRSSKLPSCPPPTA
eukprot:9029739-Pyramimonas_sp.AAC.1